MFAILAAVLFVIAFVVRATSAATVAVFSPLAILLLGLAMLALHMAGYGSGWSFKRRRRFGGR